MRFYLDLPLVIGYALMATAACLGMLQLAAARGGYCGLSLFTNSPKLGKRIGLGLTIGAVVAYVLIAPEILTPGPAGTEVAEMFAFCAVLSLGMTLTGAEVRIRQRGSRALRDGEAVRVGELDAVFFLPLTYREHPTPAGLKTSPTVIVLADPTKFVVLPPNMLLALRAEGMAVLVLDGKDTTNEGKDPDGRNTAAEITTVLSWLEEQPMIDPERIGLLGLGASGDAVIHACNSLHHIKATLAVSPVLTSPYIPGVTKPGLEWLREMSYYQIWRWRRRWPTLHYRASDLIPKGRDATPIPAPTSVLHGSANVITTRKSWSHVELILISSSRHFTLLENDQARAAGVRWFKDILQS